MLSRDRADTSVTSSTTDRQAPEARPAPPNVHRLSTHPPCPGYLSKLKYIVEWSRSLVLHPCPLFLSMEWGGGGGGGGGRLSIAEWPAPRMGGCRAIADEGAVGSRQKDINSRRNHDKDQEGYGSFWNSAPGHAVRPRTSRGANLTFVRALMAKVTRGTLSRLSKEVTMKVAK